MPTGPRTITTARGELLDAKAGDRAAFERLVAPVHDAARALAVRMLGNLDDAEDAMQDALIKTYRGLAALPDDVDFRGWLLRVVYHQALDGLRRRRTRARHEAAQPVGTAGAAGDESARRETLRRVHEVMAELPDKQRAALHLRVHEGLDYARIGAVLGLTPASARVYVVRARSHLRDRLGTELEDR